MDIITPYLPIICPKSHEKLTNSEIMSSCSRIKHYSKSFPQPSLFVLIHMQRSTKNKLGKVAVSSNSAQIHSPCHREVYLDIICPTPQERLTKLVGVSSNITPNHFLHLQEVISGYEIRCNDMRYTERQYDQHICISNKLGS